MKKVIFALLFCHWFCLPAYSQEAAKIDEFETDNCETHLARMDNLISFSSDNPTARIYMLVYEGMVGNYNYDKQKIEYRLPTFGLAQARLKSIKDYISKVRGYSVKNFVFVSAGFLEKAKVEVWTVPNGATPPKPSSTLTKVKYRKGKSKGFCLSCECG